MKRLVVLCDGTGQSTHRGPESAFPTNVKTFGDCLAQTDSKTGQPVPQIIYYQSGVGTSEATWATDTLAGTTIYPHSTFIISWLLVGAV